jgi:hypothetical protein
MKKPKCKKFKYPKPHIDKEGYLRGVIAVDLNEIVERDLEGFLSLLSQRLSNTDVLADIYYEIVGFDAPDTLYLETWGDPSMVLECSEKFKKMWNDMEKKHPVGRKL